MSDTTTPAVPAPASASKSILASKTFWVNALGGIVAGTATYGGYIPPKYAPAVIATGSIANILLRFLTNQPIQ
jgi:hypothetical protein